jgi:hypothetical protein
MGIEVGGARNRDGKSRFSRGIGNGGGQRWAVGECVVGGGGGRSRRLGTSGDRGLIGTGTTPSTEKFAAFLGIPWGASIEASPEKDLARIISRVLLY